MGQLIDKCRVFYLDDQSYQRVAEEGINQDEARKSDLSEQLHIQINGRMLQIRELHSRGDHKAAASCTRLVMTIEAQKKLVDGIVSRYQAMRSSTVSRHALRQTATTLKEWGEKSSGLNMNIASVDADSDQVANVFENFNDVEAALAEAGNRIEETDAAGDMVNGAEAVQARLMEIVTGQSGVKNTATGEGPAATTATAAASVSISAAAVADSKDPISRASEAIAPSASSKDSAAAATAQPAQSNSAAVSDQYSRLLLNI